MTLKHCLWWQSKKVSWKWGWSVCSAEDSDGQKNRTFHSGNFDRIDKSQLKILAFFFFFNLEPSVVNKLPSSWFLFFIMECRSYGFHVIWRSNCRWNTTASFLYKKIQAYSLFPPMSHLKLPWWENCFISLGKVTRMPYENLFTVGHFQPHHCRAAVHLLQRISHVSNSLCRRFLLVCEIPLIKKSWQRQENEAILSSSPLNKSYFTLLQGQVQLKIG